MKILINKIIFFVCICCSSYVSKAQVKTSTGQVARGYIVDRASGSRISNAEVELLNCSPRIASLSNEHGEFMLKNIPIGHQRIRVKVDGYYESLLPELVVSGKELVVTIAMDEVLKDVFVTVSAKRNKKRRKARFSKNAKLEPVDALNAVSTVKFDIQEVTKYVGGWGDPARILTNFPGLYNIDDAQNYIVSRGNSPLGIRWQIDGVPVENPHHFATLGNTGAIFPILNNSLLGNSDFINGAMSAHYGNSYSGVFDINLRTGNNQKYEFAAQISLYGAELLVEGPIKKGGASFALSYRYGIFTLVRMLGVDVGGKSVPQYQDLNFKINIPTTEMGTFTIFGVGGASGIAVLDEHRDLKNLFAEKNIDIHIKSNTGVVGVSHKKYINKTNYIKTVLAYNIKDYTSNRDTLTTDSISPYYRVNENIDKVYLSSTFNSKLNSRALLRAGGYASGSLININNRFLQKDMVITKAKEFLVETGGFAELEYKFSREFKFIAGLHTYYWSLNKKSWSVEPRVALNWQPFAKHKFSLGYGWHSKTQPLPIVFHVHKMADGGYNTSNRELGSTRSHHIVISYDYYIAKHWALKFNIYTQFNTNMVVEQKSSSFSLNNYGAFAIFPRVTNLENTGIGINYGAEFLLEKFFSKGYYGLAGATYTRARYQASDKKWYRSTFDALYVAQFVAGKEFKIGKFARNIFYFDFRYSGHGGQPYTPIDLMESRIQNKEVRDYSRTNSLRLKPYNRIDFRFGFRFNHRKKKISHHIYLEALNIAMFQNDLQIKYDVESGKIVRSDQFGLVPMFLYQIRF